MSEQMLSHIIDCDAEPFIPHHWVVEEHQKGGQLEWDAKKVFLYICDEQNDEDFISGYKLLYRKLEGKAVLNANVLDYLLAHTELIPEEWKGKQVYFWGTVYHGGAGGLCVRYLAWNEHWYWFSCWLDTGFDSKEPAALLRK